MVFIPFFDPERRRFLLEQREAERQGCCSLAKVAGSPFRQPLQKARSAGQIGRIADLHASHPKGEVHGCAE
ncbi:MAG: hypothetical protein ACXV7F_09595 [Methylomonas sp.]